MNYVVFVVSIVHMAWYAVMRIWVVNNVWYAWPLCNMWVIILMPMVCMVNVGVIQAFIFSVTIFPQIFVYQ